MAPRREPPLRGRETALAAVDDLLQRLHAGRGGILVVHGVPGIGKTRMLSEAGARAQTAGVTVAAGQADQGDAVVPLAPVLTALSTGEDPVVPRDELRALERPGDQRFWLLEELADILERRSERSPVLLLLDDLHWADEATVWAVQTLAPRLLPSPVAWILAVRPGEVTPHVARLVDLLTDSEARSVVLGPLADGDVGDLARDVLGADPDDGLRSLLAGAAGNPFLGLELVRTLVAEGSVRVDGGVATVAGAAVPERFRARIGRRLASFPTTTSRFLETASIFGRTFSVADVAAVLRAPAGALLGAVQEAVSADILEERGEGLSFRHDLIHQAIADGVPPGVRGPLHREAADAVIARGGSAVEAAGHLLAYAQPHDQAAIAVLQQAAASVAPTAPRVGADLMVRAVELMEPGQPGWLESVIGTVNLLAWATRFAEAMTLADRILAGHLDPTSDGLVRLGVSDAMLLTARRVELIEHAREALARPDLPDGLRAQFLHNLANGYHQDGQIDASERAFEEALRLADPTNVSLVLSCLIGRNLVRAFRGHLGEALSLSEATVEECEQAGPVGQQRMPLLGQAAILSALDRFDEAGATLERATEVATSLGAAWALEFGQRIRVAIRWDQGRLADAAAEAEADLAMAEALDLWHDTDLAFGVLAQVAFHQNDFSAAAAYVAQAADPGRRYARSFSPRAAFAEASVLDADGRHGEAVATLSYLYDRPDALTAGLAIQPDLGPRLVRFALRAGDRARATTVVGAGGALARWNPDSASHSAAAKHAVGLLDEDPSQLVAAAEAFTHSGRPLARSSAFEDAGRALVRKGDAVGGAAWLERAFQEYRELGATRDEARARRRLRDAGVRRRPRSSRSAAAFGWDSLSPAELRVVHLVAEGCTNREIAERLFVSPYTVGTHLKHVFTKLALSSRVELTRVVTERGTPAPTG